MNCTICNAEDAAQEFEANPVCDACMTRIEDYADKVAARVDRLHTSAERIQNAALSDYRAGRDMFAAIPFGQPMMPGHHSFTRDRNYRLRADNLMRRGFKKMVEAQKRASRAESAESNRAISSDDPAAIIKLQAKIDEARNKQEWMKRANRVMRQAMKLDESKRAAYLAHEMDVSLAHAAEWLTPDFAGRTGIPSYALSNNNANIRRMEQRLAELKAQAARAAAQTEAETETRGDITIERDANDNRLRLYFPGKPDAETRTALKSCGFRWSPSAGAWQRQLSGSSDFALDRLFKLI